MLKIPQITILQVQIIGCRVPQLYYWNQPLGLYRPLPVYCRHVFKVKSMYNEYLSVYVAVCVSITAQHKLPSHWLPETNWGWRWKETQASLWQAYSSRGQRWLPWRWMEGKEKLAGFAEDSTPLIWTECYPCPSVCLYFTTMYHKKMVYTGVFLNIPGYTKIIFRTNNHIHHSLDNSRTCYYMGQVWIPFFKPENTKNWSLFVELEENRDQSW